MPKAYLINTNKSNNANCETEMFNNQKCAAYYSPWKYYIDQIEVNDIVFLYSTGSGIIARGIATGIPEIADWEDNIDEEHYMNLNRFEMLKYSLTASKITEIVGHEIIYHQTIISLTNTEGIKLWQHITKNCM